MWFDMKSIVLYGLLSIAYAAPAPSPSPQLHQLSKRAKLGSFKCPDGNVIDEEDVRRAFNECKKHDDSKVGKYPFPFGNKRSQNGKTVAVLAGIPATTKLREFPIVEGGTYGKGMPPGKYRVVTDYANGIGNFRGVIQHTGATIAGGYAACKRVEPEPQQHDCDDGKDPKKDDKKDDKKEDKGKGKEKKGKKVAARGEDLAPGLKRKMVTGAICDGVTLPRDDIGSAFHLLKNHGNYEYDNYPHDFSNKSGGSDVFPGVTKQLREYPVIQGGTWTVSAEPGRFRVVADDSGKFIGVMVEQGENNFMQCTLQTEGRTRRSSRTHRAR
ncbi:hypothetical protein AJ79_09558 [Helicocarpus griseus UAMH5409]|uniref:Uncharacterized protein n=1 Tax=Helicocarpus griseus UAMH5409 TaxID=1447875 RepID=A0A2B7WIY6_9EURO|nr:hypothetical protein AJ79_09558 [Helicocarpus griseus UAMH5409]